MFSGDILVHRDLKVQRFLKKLVTDSILHSDNYEPLLRFDKWSVILEWVTYAKLHKAFKH